LISLPSASQTPRSRSRQVVPNRRIKTRSFYIDEKLLISLKAVAASKGVSVNSLAINILENYVKNSVNAEAFGYVAFPGAGWADLVGALDDVQRSQLAQKCGALCKEVAMAVGYSKTLNSYLLILDEMICGWSKWANYREADTPNAVIVTMYHNHGISWSLFISEFISCSLKDFITAAQMNSIELGSAKSGVIIRIPRDLLRERDR